MTQILQQKCKIKGGTRVWHIRNMCLVWHSYKFGTLFLFLEYSVPKKIAWQKSGGGGAIAPSAPPGVVGPPNVGRRINIFETLCVPVFRQNGQFYFFDPNLPKNGFWDRNFEKLSPDAESPPPR